jgi:hypothetical protein
MVKLLGISIGIAASREALTQMAISARSAFKYA